MDFGIKIVLGCAALLAGASLSGCGTFSANSKSAESSVVPITNSPAAVAIATSSASAAENRPLPLPPVVAKIDLEAERRKLLETDNSFSAASEQRGTAQAFYEYLDPDAISLPMDGLPIQGRDAIRVQLAAGPPYVLIWKPAAAEVSSSGDLGYTWGNFEQRSHAPNGRPQTKFGKYITVWKKQPDGSWKAILDGGNLSPAPQQRR